MNCWISEIGLCSVIVIINVLLHCILTDDNLATRFLQREINAVELDWS